MPSSWLGRRVIAFLHSEYISKRLRSEEKQMSSEALLFPLPGLLGYAMGFALKKGLKWLLIIIGFLAGMFFFGVELSQRVCECGRLGLTTLNSMVFRTAIQ